MLSRWIASLPETEKNTLLFQVASGGGAGGRVSDEPVSAGVREGSDRTFARSQNSGEIRAAGDRRSEDRKRREEEHRRLEQERKAQEKAADRTKHLDDLEKREPESWSRLDGLVATKRPKDYDLAVALLIDLRNVAVRKASSGMFDASKPSFLRKLKKAGLEV